MPPSLAELFSNTYILTEISHVIVGDGSSTFFWLDRWVLPERLCIVFPALFTHHKKPNALVANIMMDGIELGLRSRLTLTASHELASLRVEIIVAGCETFWST